VAGAIAPLLGTLDQPAMPIPSASLRTFKDATHGDGEVHATRLNTRQDIITDVSMTALGTAVDEMDLNVIKKIPSLLAPFTVSNAAAAQSFIGGWYVDPFMGSTVSTVSTTNTLTPTNLAYMSMLYSLWRGNLTLTLKMIATSMQRGRILVSFLPGYTVFPVVPSFAEASNNIITTIDFMGSQDFVIDIPYVSRTKWMRVTDPTQISTQVFPDPLYCTGFLGLWVLNVATNSVATPATFVIQPTIAGGDDYSVQMPRRTNNNYQFYTGAQVVDEEYTGPLGVAQSGAHASDKSSRENEQAVVSITNLISNMRLGYLDPNEHMDLQKMLRRPSYRGSFILVSNTNFDYRTRLILAGGALDTTTVQPTVTFFNHFTSMYRYFVGSLRWSFMLTTGTSSEGSIVVSCEFPKNLQDASVVGASDAPNTNAFMYPFQVGDRSLEVVTLWQTPFTKCLCSPDQLSTTLFGSAQPEMYSHCDLRFSCALLPSAVNLTAFVALADETRLTTFIGPRRLVWTTA
jgi:hypothetical protein